MLREDPSKNRTYFSLKRVNMRYVFLPFVWLLQSVWRGIGELARWAVRRFSRLLGQVIPWAVLALAVVWTFHAYPALFSQILQLGILIGALVVILRSLVFGKGKKKK